MDRPRFPVSLRRPVTEDQVSRLLLFTALVPGTASAGLALIIVASLIWR